MEKEVVNLSAADRLWAWFEVNKMRVAWGAGIIVVVGFAAAFYMWRQAENEVAAGEALSRADETKVIGSVVQPAAPEVYLKIASDYPGTTAASRALLEAAASLFVSGKYADAQAQFERFVSDYANSPFLPQAKLGIASCLDALGKTNDAANAYEAVAKNYSGSNVAPQAEFALARIHESQGQLEQAWSTYEKLAQQLGLNDSIGSEAGIRAEEIKAKLPPPAASATTNALPLMHSLGVGTNEP